MLAEDGTSALVPSVVSFHPSGDVLVGAAAKERRLLDATNTVSSIKRLIGRPYTSYEVKQAQKRFPFEFSEGPSGGVLVSARGETYTLSEISAFVLRHIRKVAEDSLGQPCEHAVVTVPANFNELQRSATKAAGRVAGLDVLRIVNEPTAAALAYGYKKTSNERVAVYDLGGGTFDITILQLAGDVFEVLATAGDTFLGGDDIDNLIADDMAARFLETHRYDAQQDSQAFERLRAAAEWAKCQLSDKPEVKLCIEELAYGEGGAGLDLDYALRRADLEKMTHPLIARSFDVCEDAMKAAGLRPTQLDNVILVGGSTRIPLLQRMVTEYFGRKPQAEIDPDLVVAQGAAIQAQSLAVPTRKVTAALGRVALKKVIQTGKSPVVSDELEDEVTTIGDRVPLPPPPVARGARKATLQGQAPVPPVPPADGELGDEDLFDDETKFQVDPLLDTPTRAKADVFANMPEENDDAVADTPTRSRVDEPLLDDLLPETPTPTGEDSFDETLTRIGDAVDPLDFQPTRTADASGLLMEIGDETAARLELLGEQTAARLELVDIDDEAVTNPPEEPETIPPAYDDASGLITELGDDAFGSIAEARPGAAVPPLPPLDLPGSASSVLEASLDEDVSTVTGALPIADGPAPPLLLDVTPLSLGVETVDGYCEHIIRKNSAIPAGQTKMFTTARDKQETVVVRICQGEARRISSNQLLGEVVLEGLRPAARGKVQIAVRFMIDADGTLSVRAQDVDTGQQQQIAIKLIGELEDDQIDALRERHEAKMGA